MSKDKFFIGFGVPKRFRPFADKAVLLVQKGGVGTIEFSGATYQIHIFDPAIPEGCWAFLQLDEHYHLKDAFCSCEEGGESGACVHLAAAYLRIFNKCNIPMHVRYQKSFWNRLCMWFADKYGDDAGVLEIGADEACSVVEGGKAVFTAEGLTPEGRNHLKVIFFERRQETEETSLKFSNLSPEEIQLWKAGRPSAELRYELSFWNDLAKWLFLMQDEKGGYELNFNYSPSKIPDGAAVRFTDVQLKFELDRGCLEAVVPALTTIHSPLKVYGTLEEAIEKMHYDSERGRLIIFQNPKTAEEERMESPDNVAIGNWIYAPFKGFYPKFRHALLEKSVYKTEEIPSLFAHYYTLIKAKLDNVRIRETLQKVSYKVEFDSQWNLHIETYIFKPGDLKEKHAKFFGAWAYLDEKGFIPLEGVVFPTVDMCVPEDKVGDFVQQYRLWLDLQGGFHTHISSIETVLKFAVDARGKLSFIRLPIFKEAGREAKDFDSWVFVKGEGFFSKAATHINIPAIRTGAMIQAPQVSSFIRNNRYELGLIPGFFSDQSPVEKMGLNLELSADETIVISPEYVLRPEYADKTVLFYDCFTYVEKEGFCQIPAQALLPERFRHLIQIEQENLRAFFNNEFEIIKQSALWVDPRLIAPKKLNLVIDSLVAVPEGYALKLHFETEKNEIHFKDVLRSLHKKGYLFSEAGLIDLNQDRFRWLNRLAPGQFDKDRELLTLSTLDLFLLIAFDAPQIREGAEILAALMAFDTLEKPDLKALKSHLRPYQEFGLHWLWFLYQNGLAGLLCDDMGLGKTHQAMALIAAIMNSGKGKCHYLIVCPTSVIYHWEEKLNEFLPEAKVCTFHGSNRSFEDFHKDYDILLTSFGIWRNEFELLNTVFFEVAIFDEIQAAKNQSSRIHASLLTVKARVRIGLTGTPIENRLQELKALFDIVLPRFLFSESDYRQFFIIPIERELNQERKKLLSRIIKPFILRRKKEEVLTDLPEKIEEVIHCELSLDQKLLYNDLVQKSQERVLSELADGKMPIPYIHIFSILSALKQICNHPAAYLKTPESYKNYQSGKWDLFVELLGEALESGLKVVIFSQYLSMLDIFGFYLDEINIKYASIRGATVRRKEEIAEFNKNPSCQVFLGSLQAAGLGIDLTAGSVVIHYDRWWNAAREDQATDRVHRIGQERGVQVFKLVTKGTFEERIDEMIARKGKLMEEVVGADDSLFMKKFDREELMQLLRLCQ